MTAINLRNGYKPGSEPIREGSLDKQELVQCSGLLYRHSGRCWMRPRMVPNEERQQTSDPKFSTSYRIEILDSVVEKSEVRWVTVRGEWKGSSQQLRVREISGIVTFTDFFTPEPTTRLEVKAPPVRSGIVSMKVAGILDKMRADGDLVSSKVLRGSNGGQLLVCSAVRPHAVTKQLEDLVGESLYVTRSPWDLAEFNRCAAELVAVRMKFKFIIHGTHVGRSGQNVHIAIPVSMTDELGTWASRWTPGLLEFRPWLRLAY